MLFTNKNRVKIGNLNISNYHPVFIIAEIGINHNGSVDLAKQLIDIAIKSGCNAVKFQKRTPDLCVPEEQRNILKETPWGIIPYIEYRKKIEFGLDEYAEIDWYCKQNQIIWFASCWDIPSVDFIEQFNTPLIKVPSAMLTNKNLIQRMKFSAIPVLISTGMSTFEEIENAVSWLGEENLLIAHSTSCYPCKDELLNLNVITTLKNRFKNAIIGYSGHEVGLPTTLAAVTLGASFVERHLTLDRAMWGTDQAASVEEHGFEILVKHIRSIEKALGDGVKRLYDEEKPVLKKLRKVSITA